MVHYSEWVKGVRPALPKSEEDNNRSDFDEHDEDAIKIDTNKRGKFKTTNKRTEECDSDEAVKLTNDCGKPNPIKKWIDKSDSDSAPITREQVKQNLYRKFKLEEVIPPKAVKYALEGYIPPPPQSMVKEGFEEVEEEGEREGSDSDVIRPQKYYEMREIEKKKNVAEEETGEEDEYPDSNVIHPRKSKRKANPKNPVIGKSEDEDSDSSIIHPHKKSTNQDIKIKKPAFIEPLELSSSTPKYVPQFYPKDTPFKFSDEIHAEFASAAAARRSKSKTCPGFSLPPRLQRPSSPLVPYRLPSTSSQYWQCTYNLIGMPMLNQKKMKSATVEEMVDAERVLDRLREEMERRRREVEVEREVWWKRGRVGKEPREEDDEVWWGHVCSLVREGLVGKGWVVVADGTQKLCGS